MQDLKEPRSESTSEAQAKSNGRDEALTPQPLLAEEEGEVSPLPVHGDRASNPSPGPFPYTERGESSGERAARGRSLRMQYRFWRTLIFAYWLFGRLLFWHLVMRRVIGSERVEQGNMRRWMAYTRAFRSFAISMGGVMIKLGQFISTRVDALPPEITNELAGLQDEVPAVPNEQIMAVIEREVGAAHYSWIDTEPVAAASLGQVYRAKLHNGERVVVKVQRPGIREIVYTDLAALRIVARFAGQFRFIRRRADTVALTDEFGRVLREELSYHHEAQNAARFAEMFKDDLGVYIPAIYPEHSTDSVLTMEDVTTIKINDYAALEAAGISRKAVAKRLMDTYMQQVFEERFFHADPHPGNLFVYPLPAEGNGSKPFYLIFVDFGMTGSLTPGLAAGLINTLTAIVTRDAEKLVASYSELGFLLPDADTERIEEATKATFDQVWGLSMTEIRSVSYSDARALGKEFNDLLYSMPFQVPQDFIYLGRAMGILSGMATSLDPDFNPWEELQPYAQKMIQQSLGLGEQIDSNLFGAPVVQSLFNGNGAQALVEAGKVLLNRTVRLPMRLDSVLAQVERGEITVRVTPTAAYRKQLQRLEAQGRRTMRAVIFGSLLIVATLFYTNGDVALAVVGYGIAGLALLWTVLGGGE